MASKEKNEQLQLHGAKILAPDRRAKKDSVKVVKKAPKIGEEFRIDERVIESVIPDDLKESYERKKLSVNKVDYGGVKEAVTSVDWTGYDIEEIIVVLGELSEKITGMILYPYQKPFQDRIFRSLLTGDGADITITISRQGGKTTVVGDTIVTCCIVFPELAKVFPEQLGHYIDGLKVGIFGPSSDQSKIMWDRIKEIAESSSAEDFYESISGEKLKKVKGLQWSNKSIIEAFSANPKANIEGRTLHIAIIDEAQFVKRFPVRKSIAPMLSTTNGPLVMIGVCGEELDIFYDQIQLNEIHDLGKPPELRTNFCFDYETVQKYNEKYELYVKREKMYGDNTPEFNMNFKLIWPKSSSENPISKDDIKDYCLNSGLGFYDFSTLPVVVSIDLGANKNRSVMTVTRPSSQYVTMVDDNGNQYGDPVLLSSAQILNFYEWEGVPYPHQRAEMRTILQRFSRIDYLILDGTGAGVDFYEECKIDWEDLDIGIMEPYVFSSESKSVLTSIFNEFFWKRRLIIPSDEKAIYTKEWKRMVIELSGLVKMFGRGKMYYAKNPKKHYMMDDYFDSISLGLYGVKMLTDLGQNDSINSSDIKVVDNTSQSSMMNILRTGSRFPSPKDSRLDRLYRSIHSE